MISSWFRGRRNPSTRSTPGPRSSDRLRRWRTKIFLEELESRIAPATVNWINLSGGDWSGGSNWDVGHAPLNGDDVVIPTLSSGTITHSSGTDTIQSLSLGANLNLTDGSLTITSSLFISQGRTLTNNASLILANGVTATIVDNFSLTGGIVVNGTMMATGAIFNESGSNGSDITRIQVNAGGKLIASDCTFGWDQLNFATGSLLGAGDLTNNGFDTTVSVPITGAPLLASNRRFQDVNINPDNLGSGTVTLNAIGTDTTANLRYVFPGAFTVQAGATLNVAPAVKLLIQSGVTVTVSGALNLGTSVTATIVDNFSLTGGIVVNGTMTATGVTFDESGSNGSDITRIQVNGGGKLTAGNCTFGWDQLNFANGSLLSTGDLTGNGFDTILSVPIEAAPLLANNRRFQDIHINTGSLSSGSIALNAIGTDTSANLRYVFPGAFTIQAGATLNVAPAVNVLIQTGATVTASGTLNLGAGVTVTIVDNFSLTGGIVVTGTMTATGVIFNESGPNGSDITRIQVNGGGQLIASNCTFGWDQLNFATGSIITSGDLADNGFDTTVSVPIAAAPLLANNRRFQDININPDGLASGAVSLNAIGTDTIANLRYVFPGAFTVQVGATLNVAPAVNVLIQTGATVTVNGALNLGTGVMATVVDNFSLTGGIVVNGTMTATGVIFNESGSNGSDITRIQVNAGGKLIASDCTFGWDQLNFATGSLLGPGDLTNNGFDTILAVPIVAVPLLASNRRFQDVNINPDNLGSGTVTLNAIGTDTIANLRYVFPGAFTIQTGAILNVAPAIRMLIQTGATVTVDGTLSLATGVTATAVDNFSLTGGIVVNGTMSATGATFNESGSNGSDITRLQVNAGGRLIASGSTFGWDQVNLNAGAFATIQVTRISSQLTIDSSAAITISQNDLSTVASNGVIATGSPSATINLANNYWGTTDTTQIGSKILDHADSPVGTRPTVQFLPLLNQRPTQSTALAQNTTFNVSGQTVTLTANVTSPSGVVNEGTQTFTILSGTTVIGTPVTVNVVNGTATTSYSLPAGTPGGAYTIQAVYDGSANFSGSPESLSLLTVSPAAVTNTATSVSATYSAASQTLTVTATISSAVGTVNEGTQTFTLLSGSTVIGDPVTVNVTAGVASALYTLPAGVAPGSVTIQAVYNGTNNFLGVTDSTQSVTIDPAPPATVAVSLDPGSDSGAPQHPGFTSDTTPTFSVQVNQAGTITMDFNGNIAIRQMLMVAAGGTYSFTAPTLADGGYQATVSFNAGLAGTVQDSMAYTIDTAALEVATLAPSGTFNNRVSQLTVTFAEPVDLGSFAPAAITFTGPGGVIAVNQPQHVTGGTYHITFATQTEPGPYTVAIAGTVTDRAGNPLGQAFNGGFTIALPDLAVTATSAPAAASMGTSIPVGWTTVNGSAGNATGGTWHDAVYLSSSPVLDGSAILLTSVAGPAGPLAPLASYARSTSVTLPGGLAPGGYYLLFVANHDDGQHESDAGVGLNNVATRAITLSGPDLQATGVSGPATGFTGQTVLVSWTVTNTGAATATGPWVDSVYLSADAQGSQLTLLGSFTFEGTLTAGATVERTVPIHLPQDAGTHWFVVTTNATQTVAETGSFSNNTAVAGESISIAAVPLPDLVVTGITPPANGAFSGTSVTISFVVSNQGQAPTSVPVWQDWVILSQDPTLADAYHGQLNAQGPGGDQVLAAQPVVAGFSNPSYLGVGENYQQTVEVQLPIDAQGLWYVNVVPDGTGARHPFAMPQMSRTNKLAQSAGFSVTLSPPPDLTVTSLQVPAQNFSGQPATVSWTVANQGTGPTVAEGWTDAIYMSTSPTLDASALLLATFTHQGVLASGSSMSFSETVTLPVGVSGEFYFFLKTDFNGDVFENGATANNVTATATPRTVHLTPPPDLEVSSIVLPATALAGHGLTFSYTVTNAGAGSTPNYTWIDSLYLSPTPVFHLGTAIPLSAQTHQGNLAAGASYANTVTATLSSGLAGSYYLFVSTDSGNAVFELDDLNNSSGSPTAVLVSQAPADLVVVAASAPTAAVPGSAILVKWTVVNQSTGATAVASWKDNVYLSSSSTFDGNAILLGSLTHHGLLAGGGSYATSQLLTLPIHLLGAFHIFVVTDASGDVQESNTANNTFPPLPITISLQNGTQQAAVADLQVVLVTASAVTDGNVTVNWTVQNSGTGVTNATYWNDDVWMSTNPTLASGGTDWYLGTVQRTNPLAAGGSYSASGAFTVPQALTPGNYYFIVATDRPVALPTELGGEGVDRVYESNSTNNQSATAFAILAAPAPLADLSVVQVTVGSTATSGGELAVNWTVANSGADTGNFSLTDSVYLSYDPVFDRFTDHYLGSATFAGGLAGGTQAARSASLALPAGLAGTFWVFVVANSTGRIAEVDATNNSTAAALPVQVLLSPPADLVAGTIVIPANAVAGQSITITYQVTNAGSNPANGSWYDSLYLSPTPSWHVSNPLLGRVFQTQSLAPGASYMGNLTTALPGTAPGSYYVILRSNILNSFPEPTRSNNLSVSLAQTAIDAQVLPLGTVQNGTLNEGQAAFYKVIVSAGQTLQIDLTSQTATAANELYVRFGTMPSRSQYDFRYSQAFAANQRITIPTTQAGAYYVLVHADSVPGGPENYSIQAAIIPFSVQAVTPGDVGAGPVTLRISGARFALDTSFELRKAGGVVIAAERILVQDSATALVTFDLTGHAAGSYDVWAIQAGGPSTVLAGGLTVGAAAANPLQVALVVPEAVMVGRPATITMTYSNPGNTDLPAPLLLLEGENALFQVPGQSAYTRSAVHLFGFNPDGPFGTLPPGFQGSITLSVQPITAGPGIPMDFTLRTVQDPGEPFDWQAVAAGIVPTNTSPQQWAALVSQAATLMGNTWGDVVSFLGTASVQLLENTGVHADPVVQNSLHDFDALLQYAIGIHGAAAASGATPAFPVLAAQGQVTLYNANLDGLGNPRPLDRAFPTYVIVPGLHGYRTDFGGLAAAIAGATAFSSGQVNVIIATWDGATAGLPWTSALHIDAAGADLGNLLAALDQQSLILLSTTTVVGEDSGIYVANEAARIAGGMQNAIALNPASARGGYLPPDLSINFQHSTALVTTALFDTQRAIAASNQVLPSGDLNNPILQHVFGVPWLTGQILAGNHSLLNPTLVAGADNLASANEPALPVSPLGLVAATAQVMQIASHDPNSIIGPKGSGTNGMVPTKQPLPYTVQFANEPAYPAPAQEVVITQQLDPDLDWRSFRLTRFGFGELEFEIPFNLSYYQTTIDLVQQLGFLVQFTANIDVASGIATWIFTTIHPDTGEIPDDPTIGLLPPDDGTGVGGGFVSYTIMAPGDAPTGAVIHAQATIIFDTQPPLETETIFNTVDSGDGLSSSMLALPTYALSTQFDVSWSGSGAGESSGIADYTIYVSDNNGPYQPWLFHTTLTSAPFDGENGHIYRFYSVARDNVGNVEVIPGVAQATTTVDAAAPLTSEFVFPAPGAGYNATGWTGTISGRTVDSVSGVQAVQVSILNLATGTYWNGSDFSSEGEVFFPANSGSPGTTSSTWTLAFSSANFPADGAYAIRAIGTDVAGNVEEMGLSAVVIFDTTPPLTAVALAGTEGNDGWFLGDVSVTLPASDAGAGVAATYWTIDDEDQKLYTGGPFTVSGAGNHTVTFWSVDLAGNVEEVQSESFQIDRIKPSTILDVLATPGDNGWYTSPSVSFTLDASDVTSGVAGTFFKIDDGLEQLYPGGILVVSGEGAHTVLFRSVDQAGNVEEAHSTTFMIDSIQPVTTIEVMGAGPDGGPYAFPVNVTLEASDAASGIAATYYTVDGGPAQLYDGNAFTVSGNGPHVVTYWSVDQAGNIESAGTEAFSINNGLLTVAINQAAGQSEQVGAGPILFTVVFSDAVTDFTGAGIAFTGSTAAGTLVAAVSGSGTTYTVSVTGMTGTGTVVALVAAGAAVDAAGNFSQASTSSDNSVTFDLTAPTVTINRAAGQTDLSNSPALQFTVVFSEPVTGFTGADVSLAGSTAPGPLTVAISGSGTTYHVVVLGMTGNGLVVASMPAGAALDVAGNLSLASTSSDNGIDFDMTAPTMTINQAAGQNDPVSTGPILFTVIFSEPVTGFTAADVVFTGSTAAGLLAAEVDGSGTTYTVSVTGMASSGTVVASIVAGGALDPAGNGNVASASSDNSVAFDLTAPTVTINQAAGQNDPVSTGPIEFTVVFSDDVTGFIGADISFAGSTAPGPLVADVTGSGTTYTVSVTGMAGSGIVVASVVAGAAMDAAGNFNLPSTSTDNSITYDVTAPTVTINRTVGQNDPTNSTTIHFTVVFGEPVTGFSSGDVSLAGSTAAGAAVDSVSGSGTSYTISVKGMTSNGTVAASIVAGAAQDAAGNANLASNTSSVLFDMLAPTVTINRAADQADPAMASAIRFTVVFSEAVNGFTGADVVLGGSAGASTATVGSASPDGTTYTVTVSGMTRPGTVMAQVSGGAAMDLAGNLGQASTSTDNLVVNGAILALGTDKGAATGPESTVRIIDSLTGSLLFTFVPYAGFRGGVRVALADFNHDGIPDLVTAPGNGLAGGALIHIFDGAALLQGTPTALGPGVRPFGTKYTKELFIATGRMNSSTAPDDQVPDLVVGNFQAGPRVRVLNGQDALAGTQNTLGNLNPFGNLYKGGARVAVGDVNGDGRPDVLVGQSANGSTVKVFSGEDFKTVLTSFKAGTAFKGGVFLAAGDVDGDLGTDIIVGFGSGTAAKVQVWEDQSPVNTRATRLTAADLPAVYPAPFKGGVRVAAFDLDGDGDAEVLAAPGPGAERRVRGLDGLPLAVVDEIFSAPADFAQGLFLAGARLQ